MRALGFADTACGTTVRSRASETLEDDLVRAVAPEVRSPTRGRGADRRVQFVTVDLARIQSGAFTLPLVALSHG